MQPISLAQSYAASNYLPPFSTTITLDVPQFAHRRSFYRPYGRGLGAAPIVPRADPTVGLATRIGMGLGQVIEEEEGGGPRIIAKAAQYYRPWTSLRKSGRPLLGLGQDPVMMDVEWWAKAAATALLTFTGLWILARL